jgi:outer membrane protein assembly factor BamA
MGVLLLAAAAVFPVETVAVEGAKAYPPAAIAAASGLRKGQVGDTKAFDAARDRLVATGLFVNVGYRFGPAPSGKGYAVVFEVAEVDQLLPIRFERLPVPEGEIRAHLKATVPLYIDRIPPTEQVLAVYRDAVQAFLKSRGSAEPVRARVAQESPTDLHVLFLPAAALPSVAEVHFKGNAVLTERALQLAITGAAVGAQYTEKQFREILDLGLRPLYDNRGRVRAKFTAIETKPATDVKGLVVTVTVDEGESYSLGEVRVEGAGNNKMAAEVLKAADLKTGEVLNFEQVANGQERIHQFLRRNGFMKVSSTIDRDIKDKEKVVDIAYRVEPGDRYAFGKLAVEGLDIHGEHEIKRIWGLAAGKPFNAEYPAHFLAKIAEEGLFDDLGKTESKVALNDADLTADVTLVFHSTPVSEEEKLRRKTRKR